MQLLVSVLPKVTKSDEDMKNSSYVQLSDTMWVCSNFGSHVNPVYCMCFRHKLISWNLKTESGELYSSEQKMQIFWRHLSLSDYESKRFRFSKEIQILLGISRCVKEKVPKWNLSSKRRFHAAVTCLLINLTCMRRLKPRQWWIRDGRNQLDCAA